MGIQGKRSPRGGEAKVNTGRELIDIELELMKYFHFEKNIIAFNVMGVSSILPLAHEADMLVVSKSGYLTEVEIKRTLADFCADFKKSHRHESNGLVSEFVYCIPEGMLDKAVKELEVQRFVPTGLLLCQLLPVKTREPAYDLTVLSLRSKLISPSEEACPLNYVD